jgi:PAS domain S-box-containing protein
MKSPNDQSAAAALRLQAETIAREDAVRLPEDLEAMSPEAVRRALHELRVHQIELEMQNEELRRAHQELAEARSRYFDLYDLAPAGYCTIGENGLILEGNLTIATLLGVTRHDLDNARISRFITKQDQDVYYNCFKQLFRTNAPQECELRMVKKDGTAFWAHLAATIVPGIAGDPVGRMILVDISERKRTEESLLASAEQFHTLAELAPVGIYLTDPAGNCEYANPAWCRMAGMTQAEALGQGWINGLHPEDRERVFASWQTMVSAQTRWELEYRFLNRDGGVTVVYGLAAAQHDASGRTVRYIGVNTDITARKRAEAALIASEARFREIIDRLPVPLAMNDEQQRITFLNPAFVQLFGYAREEIPTLAQWWPKAYPDPGYRQSVAAAWQAELERATRTGTAFSPQEATVVCKDGTGKTVLVSAVAFPNSVENTHLVVFYDISERKQAEAELRLHREHLEELVQQRTAELAESRDQAQAANRAKSVFLANMSHELRTPLTAVLGFSEIVSRDPAIPGRVRENMAIVLRSGEHLLALINDILDLAKIDAGRTEIELHDVDLGELVHDVVSMMRGRAEVKGLRLVIDQAPGFPCFVNTDPGKLRQILVNLVGNAIKFTSAGQIAIRLAAETTPDGYRLTIKVEDTGIGIPKNDQDRIFRPFEQVGDNVIDGTGLGLTITRQYVEMLGGRISVDSEPGQGSCFSFTIPAGRVSAATAQALPIHQHPVSIASTTAGIRILIVEDQPDNRQLLVCFLGHYGFQLREAATGQEAIAIFHEWRPHLIFMDRRMPVMDGLEATQRIRTLPGGGDTIIIAVSAHSFKQEQQEMLAAGCTDFLAKPFGADALLTLLKNHLHLELVYMDEPVAKPRGSASLQ